MSMRLIIHLHRCVGYGESLGEHSAEAIEQFLLQTDWQILPAGLDCPRKNQAWGAVVGSLNMMWFLQRGELDSPDTNGQVRVKPTDTRSPEMLYALRQRLRRLEVFAGSFFNVWQNLSAYAFIFGARLVVSSHSLHIVCDEHLCEFLGKFHVVVEDQVFV